MTFRRLIERTRGTPSSPTYNRRTAFIAPACCYAAGLRQSHQDGAWTIQVDAAGLTHLAEDVGRSGLQGARQDADEYVQIACLVACVYLAFEFLQRPPARRHRAERRHRDRPIRQELESEAAPLRRTERTEKFLQRRMTLRHIDGYLGSLDDTAVALFELTSEPVGALPSRLGGADKRQRDLAVRTHLNRACRSPSRRETRCAACLRREWCIHRRLVSG